MNCSHYHPLLTTVELQDQYRWCNTESFPDNNLEYDTNPYDAGESVVLINGPIPFPINKH